MCPECGSENIGEIKTRRLLRCRDCRRQLYTKRGTTFEDSPLGLDKWLVAVWCIANCKNGISSHELGRALGITQKSAWFLLHRVRKAMEIGGGDKFDGPTEADTTYVGGRADNMHKARREKVIKGRGSVGKDKKKPPGWNTFNSLLKKLVTVPKDKVDAKIEEARREHPRSTENAQEK